MSYDVWMELPHGTEGDRNYTSNVSPMWDRAMPGLNLRDMNGLKAGDCVDHLKAGVAAMEADPDAYRAMEPSNKWGDYEGALEYLRHLAALCDLWPTGIVRVCR